MPKIAKLEIRNYEYSLPPERAYGQARGLNFSRSCSLILATSNEGVVGIGEAGGPARVLRAYLELLKPFFLGRSIYDFEIIASEIYNRLYHFGVQGHPTACLSGISIALTDAIGKTLGVPAHDLLGGKSAEVFQCYATTGYFTRDDVAGFESQLRGIAGKFNAVKIKIGRSPASDLDRVRTARKILGDQVLMMVDINGNYTMDIALESLRGIAPYNIHWCEEPLPPTDVRGYSELRARSPVALSAGEAFYTVHDFKRLVEARGLDILQPSLLSCGGFGQAKAIAQLAWQNNLRLSPSVWGNGVAIAASLQFAASLPVWPHTDNQPFPMLIEFDVGENPLREAILKAPFTVENSTLSLPGGVGLGVEIDEAGAKIFERE